MSPAMAFMLGVILGGGAVMAVYAFADAYFDSFTREDQ